MLPLFLKNKRAKRPFWGERGFTLVELMIVVAVLGILSNIAISNYHTYQSKALTAESKLALSTSYALLKAYYSENDTYTACLRNIGYELDGSKRYYAVGFPTAVSNLTTCGLDGTQPCLGYTWNTDGTPAATCLNSQAGFPAGTGFDNGNSQCPLMLQGGITGSDIASQTFTVGARGCISQKASSVDQWTISNTKKLSHTIVGF